MNRPDGATPLVNGAASFAINSLAARSHTIPAAYSGDTNCAPSSSAPLRQSGQDNEPLYFCPAGSPSAGPPCIPQPGTYPPQPTEAEIIQACSETFSSVAAIQACIAARIPGIGGFTSPFPSAPAPPAPPPNGGHAPGQYCTVPDGSQQWIDWGAPAPNG